MASRRSSRRILAAGGLLAALLLPGLSRLETDNSPRVFFVRGSAELEAYERLRAAFGSDKVVRLAVTGDDLWTAQGLVWLRTLEEGAAKVTRVEAVSGLWSHYRERSPRWPPDDPEAFRRRVVGDALDRNLGWVGPHGEVATLLVVLEALDNRSKGEVLEGLERLVASTRPRGSRLEASVVGSPVLDRALDASSQEVGRRYFPLLVLASLVLLVAVFRRGAAVALPLLFVGLAEILLLGLMGYAGVRLNLVLVVLPPLLFVIALATAVHLLVRQRDFLAEGQPVDEAVRSTFRDKGWAVAWTAVTTFAGFTSLAVSRVGPVESLGLWAGVGIAGMALLAFTVYPALLVELGGRGGLGGRRFETFFRRWGRRWAEVSARRRGWVLGAAALIGALALAGLPRLGTDSNALHYLPPTHPVRAAIDDLEARGVGILTVEMLLSEEEPASEAGAGLRSVESFERLAELAEQLRAEPLVLGAVSAGDLLADAARRAPSAGMFGARLSRRLVFDQLTQEEDGRSLLRPFVTEDGRVARLTLFVRTVGYDQIGPLIDRALATARETFPRVRVEATGEYPLVLETQRQLLVTLVLSLSLTVAVVAVILRLFLPSTRLAALALLPNLWPVLAVLGVMGWSGLPLDVATVMVASVVLGLAVDDTIHTLGHFRELAPVVGKLEAIAGTLEHTAPAYLLTGIILVAGFGVCALSDFAPTARFGGLSALAILFALAGDLFLVPALLGVTPKAVVARLANRRGKSGP